MFGKKKIIVLFTTLLSIILILSLYGNINRHKTKEASFIESLTKEQKSTVIIRDIEIVVDIAETSEEKSQGLSGRKSLGENEGMIFLFGNNSRPSFWMKDMLIPIDIIWIANNSIVDIHKNIPAPDSEKPYSDLPLYSPKKPINFVLEVNAGFVEQNNFNIGDTVEIRF